MKTTHAWNYGRKEIFTLFLNENITSSTTVYITWSTSVKVKPVSSSFMLSCVLLISAAITLVSVGEKGNGRVVSTQRWFVLNLVFRQVHRTHSTKKPFVFLLWLEHVPTLTRLTWYILLYSSQEYISNLLLIHVSNWNLAIQKLNLCKTGNFSARNYSQHQETHFTGFQVKHISETKLSLYYEFQSCRKSYFSNRCCQKDMSRWPPFWCLKGWWTLVFLSIQSIYPIWTLFQCSTNYDLIV